MWPYQDQIRHPPLYQWLASLMRVCLGFIIWLCLPLLTFLLFHLPLSPFILLCSSFSFLSALALFISSSFITYKQQKLTLAIVRKIGIGRIKRRKQGSFWEQEECPGLSTWTLCVCCCCWYNEIHLPTSSNLWSHILKIQNPSRGYPTAWAQLTAVPEREINGHFLLHKGLWLRLLWVENSEAVGDLWTGWSPR